MYIPICHWIIFFIANKRFIFFVVWNDEKKNIMETDLTAVILYFARYFMSLCMVGLIDLWRRKFTLISLLLPAWIFFLFFYFGNYLLDLYRRYSLPTSLSVRFTFHLSVARKKIHTEQLSRMLVLLHFWELSLTRHFKNDCWNEIIAHISYILV